MTQEEFHNRYQYNPNTDCLGEGGFGKVYKAYDNHRDRFVAIKMAEVKPHLEEVRLRKEVETISKLPSHPNIAYYEECYTFSTFAGEYDFGVLQYYEQGNLQQLYTDQQLTYAQKNSLLKQILEGIAFLHQQGIIHRDLKPQNILIVNRNGEYIPKITDFGISKKLDVNKSSVFTNSLAGYGTLSFASPEQLKGNVISKNTDLWSFGVIVCWIFTGKLPFNSGAQAVTSEAGRMELFKQIMAGEASAIIQQLPLDWCNLVKQCLVVNVEKRISSATKCIQTLLKGDSEHSTSLIQKPQTTSKEFNSDINQTNLHNNKSDFTQSESINQNWVDWRTITALILLIGSLFLTYKTYNNKNISLNTVDKNNVNKKVSDPRYVTDIDGNVYKTVKIGNQVWMTENLKVTHYNNGDPIPVITGSDEWASLTSGASCNYNNNAVNGKIYGKLYNWYSVKDTRKLAPNGWHIATDDDFLTLTKYVSSNLGRSAAVAKALATKTGRSSYYAVGSIGKNPSFNNSSGFSALPSGWRFDNGSFSSSGFGGYWTSSESNWRNALCRYLFYYESYMTRSSNPKSYGFSVRCVKD